MEDLDEFLNWIKRQAIRKDQLYDGVQKARSLDEVMRFCCGRTWRSFWSNN